jgi:hypothetical protein
MKNKMPYFDSLDDLKPCESDYIMSNGIILVVGWVTTTEYPLLYFFFYQSNLEKRKYTEMLH